MKKRFLVLPCLAALGCSDGVREYKPTPPPKVTPASMDVKAEDLMPLEVGNQWSYSMRVDQTLNRKGAGSEYHDIKYRVASKRGDGAALLLLEQDGTVIDRQYWRTSAEGLYQVTGGKDNAAYTPPQPLAVLPLSPGKKFHWAGKGAMPDGRISAGDASSEVYAPQTVTIELADQKQISAIPISTKTKYSGGSGETISWFAPNIGLVRYRQESTDGPRHTVILLTLTGYKKSK